MHFFSNSIGKRAKFKEVGFSFEPEKVLVADALPGRNFTL
jgi:hypothetical protein